jgi:hypothetical protein
VTSGRRLVNLSFAYPMNRVDIEIQIQYLRVSFSEGEKGSDSPPQKIGICFTILFAYMMVGHAPLIFLGP